jgi:hypothetical protein
MTVFEELHHEVLHLHENDDFPEWLIPDILRIAENPGQFSSRERSVKTLLMQVRDFDPSAGAGCFSESFSLEDIKRTLQLLMR